MNGKRLWTGIATCALGLAFGVILAFLMDSSLFTVYAGETSSPQNGQAILVYLTDSSLGDTPHNDVLAMDATLSGTDQFNGSEQIVSLPVKEDSAEDYKTAIWNAIDAAAQKTDENSLTVFFYSGHGNAGSDGTSYLQCGGNNDIQAAELRTHLDKLQGKVLVVISACYSGGMIMPASELDDTDGQTQTGYQAEEFLEEFKAAASASEIQLASEDEQTEGERKPQYYFITAANAVETSRSGNKIGGEDVASLGHALGYDRNNEDYHVFAADISALNEEEKREGYAGDGKITMQELESYVTETNQITSTQLIYPSGCNDVLFTYGKSDSDGVPASFTCHFETEGNAAVTEDGEMTTKVIVTNLTNREIKIGIGFYRPAALTYALTTVRQGTYPGDISLGNYRYREMSGTLTCDPGTTPISICCSWDAFYEERSEEGGGPFGIKIWECIDEENTTIGNYRLMKFYTSFEEPEDKIDLDALSLQSPLQFTSTEATGEYTITKTSSQLPVQIQYDEKHTSADCTLSLYSYDLGTDLPEGLHLDEDKLLNADEEEIELDKNTQKTFFEDKHPFGERDSFDAADPDDPTRKSIYTYIMDTSDLTLSHYYVLKVVCGDGAGEEKSVYALIQRTNAAEAQQYRIPKMTLNPSRWDSFRKYDGIPAENGWTDFLKEDQQDLTVSGVSKWLGKALQEEDQNRYLYTVTKWEVWNDGIEGWEVMEDTDVFATGKKYRSTIEITIAETNNALFSSDTEFCTDSHDVELLNVSEDQKKATIQVTHVIPTQKELEDAGVAMYRVSDGKVGESVDTDTDDLYVGDKVILTAGENYVVNVRDGLKKTKETVKKDGEVYVVYEVKELESGKTTGKASIRVWKKDDDNCGCAQAVRWWTVNKKDTKPDAPDQGDTDDSSSGGSSSESGSGDDSSSGGSSSESSSGDDSSSGGSSSESGSGDGTSSGDTSSNSSSAGSGTSESSSSGASSSGSGSSENSSTGSSSSESYWENIPSNQKGQTQAAAAANAAGKNTANASGGAGGISVGLVVSASSGSVTEVKEADAAAEISAADAVAAVQNQKKAKGSTGGTSSEKGTAAGKSAGSTKNYEKTGETGSVWESIEENTDSEGETPEEEKTMQIAAVQEDRGMDGEEEVITDSAMTGDSSSSFVWLVPLIIAAAGSVIFLIIFLFRRRRDEESR